MNRHKHQQSSFSSQELSRLLAAYLDSVSDFLWATLATAEHSPAIADRFEALAQQELRHFRLLGELMLRRGIDPPVRSLLRRSATSRTLASPITEQSAEAILRSLQHHTEQRLSLARSILTAPELEAEDITATLLIEQEESVRRLRRMMS